MGKKSSLSTAQILWEAAIMYSFTGSLLGKFGTCVALIIASMMLSASWRKPFRPTAFTSTAVQ